MSTKRLLSITNLKKYFPVAKSSIFQKKQLYVRANEDISIDIYEGETVGVVGESGCGKSTLGRTLLQLYPQTAGSTVYYGTDLEHMTPHYVFETINKLGKYRRKHSKSLAQSKLLDEKVASAGGEEKAEFFLLQNQNLAHCEEQTDLHNIVKIVGGYFAVDDKEGIARIHNFYKCCKTRNDIQKKLDSLYSELDSIDDGTEKGAVKKLKKAPKIESKIQEIKKHLEAAEKAVEAARSSKQEYKNKYAGNEEFQKYEAMLDDGIDLARLKYPEMRLLRKDLQIIFQDPYSSLNPRFTIGQIIEEGLVTHNFYKHGSAKLRESIVHTMEECGLQEYMLYRYPHQFSGGQRQRISIARALAVHPKFVVCDECVSALDVSIQSQIINLLQELKEKENLTYLFISHDLSVVRYISDRICVMYLGNIVEFADAATIFNDTRHPYTVALLSSIPTTDVDSLQKERIILEGNIPSPIKPPSGCKFHTRCFMACEQCRRVPPPLREIEPGHFVACHFPERKIDENGNYLFDVATEKKSTKKAES